MTTTTTTTLTGPDVHGIYRIHTDRMTIAVSYDDDAERDVRSTRVFVDWGLAETQDAQLAVLSAEEKKLRDEDRWADRGFDPVTDKLYDQLNDRYVAVSLRLATEAAFQVAKSIPRTSGDLGRAVANAKFDKHACWDGEGCRCTPGVVLGDALLVDYVRVRIDVGPPSEPETGEIPDALLDEFTEYAIDADSLDITLDEARGGHHRAVVYRELIRRAYAAGRASVR